MTYASYTTADIRQEFKRLLAEQKFTSINREASMTTLVGSTTIEIINANFIANEEAIFGEVNRDYVKREEEWYESQSLNVNDIPGGPPKIWSAVADKNGFINSNYGWCIFSPHNGFQEVLDQIRDEARRAGESTLGVVVMDSQYYNAVNELKKNPESRRAVMIYTRPNMWLDYNKNGRSDFMCTNTVQYVIREGVVHAIVQMRSNDAVFGYKNDYAWQKHVLDTVANELNVPAGHIYWNAGSLHVYARHYNLVDPTWKQPETQVT